MLTVDKLSCRRRRADPRTAADGDATVSEQGRQSCGRKERRVGRKAAVGLDALVQAQRRQGSAVVAHAGLPDADGAQSVEVAVIANDATGDLLHADVLQRGDEAGQRRGLQVQGVALVADGRQAGVAVALEIDATAVHAVGVDCAAGVEVGREAIAGSPLGERGRRCDELLVRGRQQRPARLPRVQEPGAREVVDADTGAGEAVSLEDHRDAGLQSGVSYGLGRSRFGRHHGAL